MDVFDEINGWSARELLSRLDLPLAKDGKSYVCPVPECGNGTGDTGDGIRPRTNAKGQTRWKCHKCGKDFSNVDLAAMVFGIDAGRDKAAAAKRLAAEFNLSDDGAFSSSREKEPARRRGQGEGAEPKSEVESVVTEKKSAPAQEPKNYAKFYEYCRGNVAKFLAERGGSIRGLTAETFEKYGLGVHPNFGAEGQEKSPHLIVPIDDTHFFARAIDGHDRSHHGQNAPLYIPEPLDGKYPTFIFEGELNALSATQPFAKHGIRSFATGGATKWHKVVPELEKQFANAEQKPCFIVVFDNDKGGMDCSKLLVEDLRRAGYPAESFFFEERMKGSKYAIESCDGTREEFTVEKIDANDLLIQGEDKLVGRLFESFDKTESKLEAQAAAMSNPAERERRSEMKMAEEKKQSALEKLGIKSSSFAEYFGQDFFGDIERTSRYANRKTGFSNLDGKQIFLPGLYLLGGLPATGKTTFAWQLLNQLAERGENCIYCSYEMSRAELYVKSITRELYRREPEFCEGLNLTSANIRRGALKDSQELRGQAADFAAMTSLNLRVFELSNVSIAELIKGLNHVVTDSDKSPVVVIDYAQVIPPPKNSKNSSAKEKVDDVMLSLKDFQRATNATIIIISSFNRENYYEPVSFRSFKESGGIEYSADCVWGLENYGVDAQGKIDKERVIEMSQKEVRVVKLSCLKNRNGGQYFCTFRYYAAHDYFEPFEEKNEIPQYEFEH